MGEKSVRLVGQREKTSKPKGENCSRGKGTLSVRIQWKIANQRERTVPEEKTNP